MADKRRGVPYLTRAEAAQRLSVSSSTVDNFISTGGLSTKGKDVLIAGG